MIAVSPVPLAVELSAKAASNERINYLEKEMAKHPPLDCPVKHRFTPGLYIREIFMPKGALISSKIHMTEHPYVVSKGVVYVTMDGGPAVRIEAPFTGITKPGTRSVLLIEEDTIWTTFHPTNETDLAKIELEIIYPHEIPQQLNQDSPCHGLQ